MKCPLTNYLRSTVYGTEFREQQDCLKEECAWWNSGANQCAIRHLSHSLWVLEGAMESLVAKMPHENQFRK